MLEVGTKLEVGIKLEDGTKLELRWKLELSWKWKVKLNCVFAKLKFNLVQRIKGQLIKLNFNKTA